MIRREHGFTLIEMMLVVVITAVAASVIVMTIPHTSSQQETRRKLSQLADTLLLLRDRAMIEGRIFGLQIDGQHYHFVTLISPSSAPCASTPQERGRWCPYLLPRWHTEGAFDEQLTISLTQSGLALDDDEAIDDGVDMPQVLLLPGGEITPFEMTVSDNHTFHIRLAISETGNAEITNTTGEALATGGR